MISAPPRRALALTAALIFYDYFLTLYREIRSIWWTRFGSPSLLFYTVRYGAFLSSILIVLDVTQWSEQSNLVSHSAFSGLRAYAVCNRNRWALLGTLTLSLFYPAISVVRAPFARAALSLRC
ncbi:hypothetical protein BD414DRAFT_422764 [Trametes punicea]|nr:hypothetical protein BD414DRAFT_422764 [Trametes punicea]